MLDVGCGSGAYLLSLARKGFGNLYGCDPFIEDDIRYGDRVYIKKCKIDELNDTYDFIRFGDSFEHMEDTLETMQAVKRLLKKDGVCWINMPVFPNAAFDTFGVNWYQLDAPRHILIHSKESVEYLCRECGLKVEKIEYNSFCTQFSVSYLYEQGVPYVRYHDELIKYISEKDMEYFREAAKAVNQKQYGDHAAFTIVHA